MVGLETMAESFLHRLLGNMWENGLVCVYIYTFNHILCSNQGKHIKNGDLTLFLGIIPVFLEVVNTISIKQYQYHL